METEFSTLPLQEGDEVCGGVTAWCIRWVFPETLAQRTELAPRKLEPRFIGRGADADIVLASPSVSRAHAELRIEGRHLALRDLNSRNGIFVNGQRTSRHLLRASDIIRIGDCLGVVEEDYGPDQSDSDLVASGFHARGLLRAALTPLRRLAATDLPIVIQGETGTGKERTARAIHEWSQRAGAFVALNCAALPENLAEAELFGYRRGAFSGAEQPSLGHFRAAHGGTLFLDEAVELSPSLQSKLLRALELREVQPLGESRTYSVDIRVVAAAQEPLSKGVSRGSFRADLAARLNGFSVQLPALRERIAEVPSLFNYLSKARGGGLAQPADARVIERLCLYDWPGNVRELEMLVRRLLGLHGHEARLLPEHLNGMLPPARERPSELAQLVEVSLHEPDLSRDQLDLSVLIEGLRATKGNVAQAATRSRISRQRAYRLLQARPDFDLADFRRSEVP